MRKAFFLTSLPQLQKGAVVSALGFALFVGTSALAPERSGWVALVFAGVSLYVFWSLALCAGAGKGDRQLFPGLGAGSGDAHAVCLRRAVGERVAGAVKQIKNRAPDERPAPVYIYERICYVLC